MDYKIGDLHQTEIIAYTCLSLPIWPGLELSEIDLISLLINKY